MGDSLIDFLKTGRLGPLAVGLWMNEVRRLIGPPTGMLEKGGLWLYGNCEESGKYFPILCGCMAIGAGTEYSPTRLTKKTVSCITVYWNGKEPKLPTECGVNHGILNNDLTVGDFNTIITTYKIRCTVAEGFGCLTDGHPETVFTAQSGVEAAFVHGSHDDQQLLWLTQTNPPPATRPAG